MSCFWHSQLQDNTNICTHKATSVDMPLSWELLEIQEHYEPQTSAENILAELAAK